MTHPSQTHLLDQVRTPEDVRRLDPSVLRQLADELRQETINAVAVTGGHLGAGLGVVELTVALHHVFDTPSDRLIWDVGHQCYPHKILTGRRDRIRTLRQGGGLSGFTKRAESEYDPFGAAHASTSISAGLGMAVARDLDGKTNNVVCVIGDGAMSAGMAYEAMNNAGAMDSRLIVILNDNDMSIAPPVGAMSGYLARLISGRTYLSLREIGKQFAHHMPKFFEQKAVQAEEFARNFWTGGTLRRLGTFPRTTASVRLTSHVVASFTDGTIVDVEPTSRGVAALVSSRVHGQGWDTSPRVVVMQGGVAQAVQLPAVRGRFLATSLHVSGPNLTVAGTDFVADIRAWLPRATT